MRKITVRGRACALPLEAHPRHNLAKSIDRLLPGTPFTQESVDDATYSLDLAILKGSGSRALRGSGDTVGTHG